VAQGRGAVDSCRGVALSLARCSGSIGYGGADVDANGSKELKKYLGSVNGQLSTRRQAVLSGRVKRGERPKLQPLLTRSNTSAGTCLASSISALVQIRKRIVQDSVRYAKIPPHNII
jgi:hypothetical protein